jgi:hypothetical protein
MGIKQPFMDPAIRAKRDYWGQLHYRGAEHRPHYFQVVWEDSTTNAASVRAVQRWLQPPGVEPPPTVCIPALNAINAVAATAIGTATPFTSNPTKLVKHQELQAALQDRSKVHIPAADIGWLLNYLQLSQAQEICNPLAEDEAWQTVFNYLGVVLHNSLPSSGASVTFTAINGSGAAVLLDWLLALRAALLICFVPAALHPAHLAASRPSCRDETKSMLLPVDSGAWIIVSGQTSLAPWIKKY